MKVNESHLKEFFSQIGRIKNIIMIRDKNTGKHKGFGYIEMFELETIPNCLLFNNVVPDFQKFPILVKPSEAEKNFIAKKESGAKVASDYHQAPVADPRVYIGNLHVNITEDSLRSVVEQFGPVESVSLHRGTYLFIYSFIHDLIGFKNGRRNGKFKRFRICKISISKQCTNGNDWFSWYGISRSSIKSRSSCCESKFISWWFRSFVS